MSTPPWDAAPGSGGGPPQVGPVVRPPGTAGSGVGQESVDHFLLVNDGDDAHGCATARVGEGVHSINLSDQACPGPPDSQGAPGRTPERAELALLGARGHAPCETPVREWSTSHSDRQSAHGAQGCGERSRRENSPHDPMLASSNPAQGLVKLQTRQRTRTCLHAAVWTWKIPSEIRNSSHPSSHTCGATAGQTRTSSPILLRVRVGCDEGSVKTGIRRGRGAQFGLALPSVRWSRRRSLSSFWRFRSAASRSTV